ncbi:GGDEF domain-containing protein [Parathalassolituus penaei]|uniref:diguanylate cyclase n=1 Tax=Parathalassolituus penaei TaxID=2997323 RepID=A0A9X3EDN4_9GAMM|nr:GGDEF domain-containing protein [Parathalassolituus penaei]MCY0965687.1 GGDEF domain-containing protein [Parathalassolituus penaei]
MVTRNEPDRWRDKYLALLEQQEASEQQVQNIQTRLRRALMMVSLLAEGQDDQLDTRLRQLRDSLRLDGSDTVPLLPDTLLEQLEQQIRQSGEQSEQQHQQLLDFIDRACEQLLQAPLPAALKRQLKGIRKRARQWQGDANGCRQQLKDWVRFSCQLVRPEQEGDVAGNQSSNEQADQNGWLEQASGWFGRWLTPRPAPAGHSQPEPGFSRIARDVTATLQGLMQRLIIPGHQQQQANQLNQRLQQDLNWYELVPVLEQASALVFACIEHGQQGMEHFLQSLDQHLQRLQGLVADSSHNSESRVQFSLVLNERVEDIRSLVTGGGDLALMGARVQQQLQQILLAMNDFSEQEQQREQYWAGQVAQMQERLQSLEQESGRIRQQLARQRHQALHDALTGLPNRAAWQERLRRDWYQLQQGHPLRMAIADIDHFKRFNDTWGHQTGDRVLQLVARTLRQQLADGTFLCRLGGEEFALLRVGGDSAGFTEAIEQLRAAIEAVPWHFQGQRVSLTLSFGIARARPDEQPQQLFQRADDALYQAKANGRNRLMVAPD